MKLFYLSDVSQVDYFLSNKIYLKNFVPITGDISVSFEFELRNIKYLNEWDYLSIEDINNNFDTANSLSCYWFSELFPDIIPIDKTYFCSTSQDMVYSLEAALNAYSLYTTLFSQFHITEIHGFFLDNQAVIKTGPLPTNRAVRSVSQSILFWLCEKELIPIIQLKSKFPISLGTLK